MIRRYADKILENSMNLEKIKQGLKKKPGILNFRSGEESGESKPVATRKVSFTTDFVGVYL